jgi:hypothetical protein
MSESTLLKPIAMGAAVFALDKFAMKNPNMEESAYFAIAGAAGAYFGAAAAKAMPLPLPSGEYFDGKTVEMRIAEIGIGAGVGYGLNLFVLKNDYDQDGLMKKLGLLAVADFIAEYAVDYIQGRNPAFFTN